MFRSITTRVRERQAAAATARGLYREKRAAYRAMTRRVYESGVKTHGVGDAHRDLVIAKHVAMEEMDDAYDETPEGKIFQLVPPVAAAAATFVVCKHLGGKSIMLPLILALPPIAVGTAVGMMRTRNAWWLMGALGACTGFATFAHSRYWVL